jgi:hypothetical protein
VVNIDDFERKIVGELGWRVVYAGTDIPIDGMDVILTDGSPTPTPPPPPGPYDEARVRYIIADSQLGGVIGYYRQFPNDPNAVEAVQRWDAGIRVVNINDFERIIVGDLGWRVVYAGTDIPIDGMDVILTTDP